MQLTLLRLLQESWALYFSKWKQVAVIVVLAAIVIAGIKTFYFGQILTLMQGIPRDVLSMLENPDALRPVQHNGLPVSDAEILEEALKLLPVVTFYVVLSAIVYLMSTLAFILSSLGLLGGGFKDITMKVIRNFPRALWLWLWILLRTFSWIPIVNFFSLPIIGPRLIAAPVLVFQNGMTVREATRESYVRTKGKWLKIFLLLLFSGIVIGIAHAILVWPATYIGVLLLFEYLALLLQAVVTVAVSGYSIFVTVVLAKAAMNTVVPAAPVQAAPSPVTPLPPVVA